MMTNGFNYENIEFCHQYMEFLSQRHKRPSWRNVPPGETSLLAREEESRLAPQLTQLFAKE